MILATAVEGNNAKKPSRAKPDQATVGGQSEERMEEHTVKGNNERKNSSTPGQTRPSHPKWTIGRQEGRVKAKSSYSVPTRKPDQTRLSHARWIARRLDG